MIKQLPIVFTARMALASMLKKKTHTRRVVTVADIRRGVRTFMWKNQTAEELERVTNNRYGSPGDILYVREPIYRSNINGEMTFRYRADDTVVKPASGFDGDATAWLNRRPPGANHWPGRMVPRSISRTFLKHKSSRIHCLWDMEPQDAINEGISQEEAGAGLSPLLHFAVLWDEINAARGHGWDANPWVRDIEFEATEDPGRPTDKP